MIIQWRQKKWTSWETWFASGRTPTRKHNNGHRLLGVITHASIDGIVGFESRGGYLLKGRRASRPELFQVSQWCTHSRDIKLKKRLSMEISYFHFSYLGNPLATRDGLKTSHDGLTVMIEVKEEPRRAAVNTLASALTADAGSTPARGI